MAFKFKTTNGVVNTVESVGHYKPTIILKDSQEEAVKAILNWVNKPFDVRTSKKEDLWFTLTGSAGTGKTTVLGEFIYRCTDYVKKGLCVTAPTHKAKKVISKATKLNAATIQSLLGLRPNTDLDNFDHNRPQFDPLNEGSMSKYRVIIIDETSMVNSDLFDLLCKESLENKVKILFVGDALQLPPVGETASRSLTDIHNKAELTEIIRQSNTNPLAVLLALLREDILNETDSFFEYIKKTPSTFKVGNISSNISSNQDNTPEGYTCLDKDTFAKIMINHFKDYRFTNNKDFCKYTAWMNKTVKSGNDFIRRTINFSNEIITTNDLLMSYSSITIKEKSVEKIILINSEDYLVTSVTPYTDSNGIKGYDVILYREDSDKNATVNAFVVDHRECDDFLLMHNNLLAKAKLYGKSAWASYYQFKNRYLLMDDLKESEKLLSKKDIDYGYGITIHKTQGSTYDNIFVNLPDIMKVVAYSKPETKAEANRLMKQLIYVALSRAKYSAYILID